MPTLVCAFDQTEHPDLVALHAHLRRFKVSQKRYYETYHPRRDRLTGDLIPFKSYDQYQRAEFVNKITLKKWLAKNREEGLVWAKEWLRKRKEEKKLEYAPSQAELRTLVCPSIPYYETVAAQEGGYYGVTRALGFKDRYDDRALDFRPLPPSAAVIEDSREQDPLKLAITTKREALEVGDYALAAPLDLGVRIERKSLSDFCGTLSGRLVTHKRKTKTTTDSALARFTRELDRAVQSNLYVVMMVESDINDAQRFNYLPQTRHIKASPDYILHNLRELLVKYPLHFQVLFVKGRTEMAAKVIRVLELGLRVKTTDLQERYEKGEL